MALPTEVERALEVERVARAACAGALRMQAVSLRTQAELLGSMARTLDEQADRIEDGRESWPSRPVRLEVVAEEPEPEASKGPGPDPRLVQRITETTIGPVGTFAMEGDEAGLTPEMGEFLERFDDRLRSSPHFVAAVNEAADGGFVADDAAARWVGDRIARYVEIERRDG